MSNNDGNSQKIIKFVQELLLDEGDDFVISPTEISKRIDMVISMKPSWGIDLDRDAVVAELIRRFSLWIGQDIGIKNDQGHVAWLDSNRKKEWRYWQRYREWLERKLSWKAVDALDKSTDYILGLLEDPLREGAWDRRGLVVGHVQSGKTGNYTGLISKSADAGYKIIIVLAGLHNNLRSQTQMRLDEGFLGYETKPLIDDVRIIGVGEIDGDPSIRPNYATNRSEAGDFNTRIARNLGITPEQRPWLFVVKKNKTVLERLYRWMEDHVANTHDPVSGKKIVTHLPLLIIDDEADNASVDTGEQVFDINGLPDDDHQPTAINSRIRKILNLYSRAAYVGYTATPFANIFIHERGETPSEGPDLFPSSFIINLAAPSNYIGPSKVFGLRDESGERFGLPLIREIEDHEEDEAIDGWMPLGHKNGHLPVVNGVEVLPQSLVEAIDAFILTCAVRNLRGQGNEHCSMLVHVTRFVSVQEHVYRQIDEHIQHMHQRLQRKIDNKKIIDRLHKLWLEDFLVTNDEIRKIKLSEQINDLPEWPEVLDILKDTVSDIKINMINGKAKDALDYADSKEKGLKVIAVGGDKLARGLTLEGLSVSYFLRASKMYDTLMQMGRWFGYRPGYLDLCRLYTTSELCEWFTHITDAAEELREEFDLMVASGASPREYGLKVQSHSTLMVTSRLKMRTAKTLRLSFSGQLLETVAFYKDKINLQTNFEALKTFLPKLKNPEINPQRSINNLKQSWSGSYLWREVASSDIIEFIGGFKTHPDAYKVNSALIVQYIQSMNNVGELTKWNVGLVGGGEGAAVNLSDGVNINMLKRSTNSPHSDKYSIGRLLSTRDESIDLDDSTWLSALELTKECWHSDSARNKSQDEPDKPNGPAIRKVKEPGSGSMIEGQGLLLIYLLDPAKAEAGFGDAVSPVVGFGVSFPASNSGVKVEYKGNNVLWEQEYGSSE
jgi:hypothetical protein